jgi:type IV pilus assembly protein PilZ
MPRQGILSLAIKDKTALYQSYMPYVRNGGIFVPTGKTYSLGDMAGIGVQFGEGNDGEVAKAKIENFLAGMINADRATHTM